MRSILVVFGYLIIVSIFIFSLVPGGKGVELFPHVDKVGHASAYALVTYWFCNLYAKNYHLRFVFIFTVQGILIEYLQGMTGYRTFDFLDMLANFTGCLLAYGLARKYHNVFVILLKQDQG